MRIWLDFCEPKSVTMLRPLYEELIREHDVFITARDFDSTHYLLNKWGVDYIPVGKYGGVTLIGRLSKLIKVIHKKRPDFLFCITSPEALRISYGLQIPNIMFNDEPRSYGPCTTTFPYIDELIVPQCIPIEWYLNYGIKEEKIIRFNGIDEVGWLSNFNPNKRFLEINHLEEEQYIVCRTEPTKAGYLKEIMKPHETKLSEIIPKLLKTTENFKFITITRNNEQFNYLKKIFKIEIKKDLVRISKGLDNLAHILYYSKMVISGGGTMVRESALLGIPSIELFPLETYPQEQFLIDNGFPLKHIHSIDDSVNQAINYMEKNQKIDTFDKINQIENPIEIGIQEFRRRTEN
jgi:predicted glycosyltransferase